ncbi:MAG: hypothetical protein DCE90_15615 [Pseudanabaena sp.]|nr:MAG: hypothetical protein DCE90_15615 [Pseudanabaena sp.]
MASQTIGSQQAAKSKLNPVTEQFLTFSLANDQQALLPTTQLLEIVQIDLTQITAISGLPSPSVMGIYNWRGEIVWVIDLASMLGCKPLYAQALDLGRFQDNCSVIFLRSLNSVIGFAVSQVGQLIRINSSAIETSGLTLSPVMAQVCQGSWLNSRDESLLVLDGNALIEIVHSYSST